jgi:endonuclease/exonuclease/phosphatase family metal-dependent hydrolase
MPARSADPLNLKQAPGLIRFATYNASLNRSRAGELIADLTRPDDRQTQRIAEVIQRVRPDVLLLNEFDYDPAQRAAQSFREHYLGVGQNGAAPNTGVPSGRDLDNDGRVGGAGDALGFGQFPGQYGMLVLSRFPIERRGVRTFRRFLWRDMPRNAIPPGWYSSEELTVLPLSSKSHWDLPLRIGERRVHLLVSHPTPPAFDGAEDRNGRRNHDEIRFWVDYLGGAAQRYLVDDRGRRGGLRARSFVLLGDLNADPIDGQTFDRPMGALLAHARINASFTPSSPGAAEAARRQGGVNATQRADPRFDTADFTDSAAGNLRVDYVLPSREIAICGGGVFWPQQDDPLYELVNDDTAATSDHRLVWIDVALSGRCPTRESSYGSRRSMPTGQ